MTVTVTLGVGRVVLPDRLSVDTVRSELRELLTDPSYAAAARRVRDEIAAMPSADEVAGRLTSGARATRPPS